MKYDKTILSMILSNLFLKLMLYYLFLNFLCRWLGVISTICEALGSEPLASLVVRWQLNFDMVGWLRHVNLIWQGKLAFSWAEDLLKFPPLTLSKLTNFFTLDQHIFYWLMTRINAPGTIGWNNNFQSSFWWFGDNISSSAKRWKMFHSFARKTSLILSYVFLDVVAVPME